MDAKLAIEQVLLASGKFYKHLDGSVVHKKCERTLAEGCTHVRVSVCK